MLYYLLPSMESCFDSGWCFLLMGGVLLLLRTEPKSFFCCGEDRERGSWIRLSRRLVCWRSVDERWRVRSEGGMSRISTVRGEGGKGGPKGGGNWVKRCKLISLASRAYFLKILVCTSYVNIIISSTPTSFRGFEKVEFTDARCVDDVLKES